MFSHRSTGSSYSLLSSLLEISSIKNETTVHSKITSSYYQSILDFYTFHVKKIPNNKSFFLFYFSEGWNIPKFPSYLDWLLVFVIAVARFSVACAIKDSASSVLEMITCSRKHKKHKIITNHVTRYTHMGKANKQMLA